MKLSSLKSLLGPASLFSLSLTLMSNPSFAMDSTELLPSKVNSPAFRYGIVSGIDSKYSSDGSIATLNDINTINFTSDQLVKISPEVTQFVNVLDQFSKQRLGSQLNLGTLRFESEPTVKYFAPIYARGITDNFTLAVAMPIVFYENKLKLNQSNSNIKAICSQFEGLNEDLPEIKEACAQLDVKIVDSVASELQKKGYKPIQDRNETVAGDLQFVSLYKAHDNGTTSTLLKHTLTLPTGQKNDPDDLADLGVFGITAFEPAVVFNYVPWRKIRLAAKASFKFVAPDKSEVRVPGSEGDILPGIESKEIVSRNIGDSLTVGGAANLAIGNYFSIAGGYEITSKGKDSYSGSRGARYDLLAKDSSSLAHKIKGGVSFDTISLYQRKKNFPPLKVDYEIINTIAGKNTDRQIVNELSLTMFF
jgi:hypothetical protein